MNEAELLRYARDVLTAERIPYFVTGSLASSYYGEPRFTNDIDIAVWLGIDADRVESICDRFSSPDFYVSREAARDAAMRGGQFNALHACSSLKIYFMILANSVYDRNRRARSREIDVPTVGGVMVAAPEDVAIMKMRYYQEGGSEKHLRDIASMFRVNRVEIDRDDIARWAAEFGVSEVWRQICRKLDSGEFHRH